MTRRPHTTKEDETDEFRTFWEEIWRPNMRRTDGRGDARDCFLTHVRSGADPQDIVDGARWFMCNLTARDKEYIPLAASWMNKRAYEDGAELWRKLQKQIAERKRAPANDIRPRDNLPENHFSKRWERGEVQALKARSE